MHYYTDRRLPYGSAHHSRSRCTGPDALRSTNRHRARAVNRQRVDEGVADDWCEWCESFGRLYENCPCYWYDSGYPTPPPRLPARPPVPLRCTLGELLAAQSGAMTSSGVISSKETFAASRIARTSDPS